MKHIIHILTREFKELFSDTNSEKKVFDILKSLQALQTSFAPRKEFRENLKSRLEAIYSVEKGRGIHHFSFFQYISVLSSFIFISGVWYILYDIYQTSPKDIIFEQTLIQESKEQNISSSSQNQELKDQILKKVWWWKKRKQWQETIWKDKITRVKNSTQEIKSIQTKTLGTKKISKNIDVIEKSLNLVEEERIRDVQESPTENSSPMIFDSIIQNDSYNNSIQKGNISSGNQIVWTNFLQLCEKYNGEVSSSWDVCTFKNGKTCSPDMIETCVRMLSGSTDTLWSDSEIFLQELLEQFGQ